MSSPMLDATEVMAFDTANWRWHSKTARIDALRMPPDPVRVTIRHARFVNGFSPPRDALEQIAEALQDAARKALTRGGAPRRNYLCATHWSGGYFLRDDHGRNAPTWTDSRWRLFDDSKDGPIASVTIRVSAVDDAGTGRS